MRRALLVAVVELRIEAGWAAFDAGLYRHSLYHYARALELAHSAITDVAKLITVRDHRKLVPLMQALEAGRAVLRGSWPGGPGRSRRKPARRSGDASSAITREKWAGS